jgi:PTS system nitrogen regulatory IIA component
MNSVAQLFTSKDVLLDLDVRNKQALFEAVGRLWEEHRGIAAAAVVENLNAREILGSTGLGQGVAIPHARVKGLSSAAAAFVRPKLPIDFDSPDGSPVAYCFVLLVPVQATEQHLQILANVAEMMSSARFREQLGEAGSPEQVYRLFADWDAEAHSVK